MRTKTLFALAAIAASAVLGVEAQAAHADPAGCPPGSDPRVNGTVPVCQFPDGQTVPRGSTAQADPGGCPPGTDPRVNGTVPVCQFPDGRTEPRGGAAPHDAIKVSFGAFGADGLPVTVSNSSSTPGSCTYDSTPFDFHQDFDVPANASTTFAIVGFPTLTTYKVRVSCTGQFNGATVVIGQVNTTKRF